MPYNRVGNSGLKLPAISLGMWHNFGENDDLSNQLDLLGTAFNLGITHFDLADNYGGGFAEVNIGNFLKKEFKDHRDELVISSKAGHQMWDGPYGDWGSRKHMISGIDQCLNRLQLDYVDIFYHHRPDSETPLEETAAALADIVRQGKALYIGISNYYGDASRSLIKALEAAGVPCLINQLPFNIFDQNAAESGEFKTLNSAGVGAITFCPLAQGLLSNKYLNGIPSGSRAATEGTCLDADRITPDLVEQIRDLNTIAEDGDEIDVYVLGIDEPVDQLDATVIAVINRKDDDENKLVATIDGSIPTESEIKEKVHFQEHYFDSFVQFAQQDDESGAAGAAPLS